MFYFSGVFLVNVLSLLCMHKAAFLSYESAVVAVLLHSSMLLRFLVIWSYLAVVMVKLDQCTFAIDPSGHMVQNDAVSTSMRRHDVASTLIRRQFYVIYPLGYLA